MKISVVMPTWNRGNRIQNAIRSIIDQTYENWELIVVDDGSTDNTETVVKSFAHPQIRYHKIEHQNNLSRVRNIGNSLATGDIIVVQDSDDMSFPDRLQEISNGFLQHPDTDVIYHGMYLTFSDPYYKCLIRMVRPAAPFERDRLKREQYIPGQIAYTKRVSQEIPYNERVTMCDDLGFLLELVYSNKNFLALDKNLYEYVSSEDSTNIHGEMDGRRKDDVRTIISILKEKYGVDTHATLILQEGGEMISKEEI